MSVIDLHPEELLDREATIGLTESEQARLEAHLERCATCRFERAARRDFADELEASISSPRLSGLVAQALAKAPPAAPPQAEATTGGPVAEEPVDRRAEGPGESVERPQRSSQRPRARARVLTALLPLVAVLAGGVAMAAGIAVVFDREPAPAPAVTAAPSSPASPTARPKGKPAAKGGKVAATPERADEASNEANEPGDGASEQGEGEGRGALPAPPPPPAEPSRPESTSRPAVQADAHQQAPSREVKAPQRAETKSAPPADAGRSEGAGERQAAVQSTAHEDAATLFAKAGEARAKGDDVAAIALYRRVVREHPRSAEASVARASLGRLLLARGENEAALSRFDEYLEAGPATLSAEAWLSKAEALDRMGKRDEEARALRELLRLHPTSAHAARARARLEALGVR